jgi:Tfp pilus assembly PilM family ATPase
VDGFADALAARFGVPVEAFDPFRQIEFEKPRWAGGDLASTAAVAVGLALRKAGDR